MKFQLVIVAAVAAVALAADDDACHLWSKNFCDKSAVGNVECNSKFGGFAIIESDVVEFMHTNVVTNFQFLLMSSHFSTYEYNREGFTKLYRQMADQAWNDAIDLIKYTTKRGGAVSFKKLEISNEKKSVATNELHSLTKAVDMHKTLTKKTHALHKSFSASSEDSYDPDASSFFENHFLSQQSDTIRALSGHANDLKKLLESNDRSLALFMFDEYLQKL